MKSISENIRQIRTALGFSQEFVSKKLKMTQQSYSNLEKNPERASLMQLRLIAEVLKVDLVTLLGEEIQVVQTNINQQGGHVAAQMHIKQEAEGKELVYQQFINNLQSQIEYLKTLVK